MKTMVTVSTIMVAAALLLTGCTAAPAPAPDPNAPLTSTAQGLGTPKVTPNLFSKSQFREVYASTGGKIDFTDLDMLSFTVQRVQQTPQLPPGDNFKATAQFNMSYNTAVKAWVDKMKKDGWIATNEVKAEPRADEDQYTGTKEDYRAKPYSVDLAKGKTTIKVNAVTDKDITLTINSQ